MKRLAVRLAVVVTFGLAAGAHAAGPTCDDLVGVWQNQLGSTLTVKAVDAQSGQVTGTYRSPSGTAGDEYPLVGWVNRKQRDANKDNVDALSFTVRWGESGSITSWTGYCKVNGGNPTVTTMWNLVRPITEFAWDHILTGSDIFAPVPTVKSSEPAKKQ